jgi:hypothetical protein
LHSETYRKPVLKRAAFFLISFLIAQTMCGQVPAAPSWSLTPFFTYNILADGHMNVNDHNFPEDTISFTQDIGSTTWSNIGATLNRTFKNNDDISLTAEYFFISGANKAQRNIWFNSVLLDSKEGITIDHSRIIRVQAFYEKLLCKPEANTRVTLLAGLIYDFQLIVITAEILNDTDAVLLHEDFNDQVIPYPQIGARLERDLSERSKIMMQAAGTYIPRMTNSGIKRKLEAFQYYCFNSSLAWQYSIHHFAFGPGITYRFFRTVEDEGKHEFSISLLGVNASVTYRF